MSTTLPIGPYPYPAINTRPNDQHFHYHLAPEAVHELKEARAELQQHHRDFGRIVALLDALEAGELEYEPFVRLLRNIVG